MFWSLVRSISVASINRVRVRNAPTVVPVLWLNQRMKVARDIRSRLLIWSIDQSEGGAGDYLVDERCDEDVSRGGPEAEPALPEEVCRTIVRNLR